MADPNKWLGLMKWSMKYSDGTAPSEFKEIKKEDREFLEKVLKEGVIDETERMRQILRILRGEHPSAVFAKDDEDDAGDDDDAANKQQLEEATPEELADYKDALLDELLTRVDQIDNAMNFVKMQGLVVLRDVVQQDARAPTRALAAEVASVVVQNNPFSQSAAVESGLVEVLCALAGDADATCRAKALLAISCLVRHHPAAEARFLSEACGGLRLLERFLTSSIDADADARRLQRKALFFARYLVRSSSDTARALLASGFLVPAAAALVAQDDDIDLSESSLEALTEFAALGAAFTAACKQPELALVDTLSARIAAIDALDADEKPFHLEIQQLARNLRTILTA
ncbi:hypothetical protein PybrP1_000215 [[Pythium] brassicae (nom. inval.)]|nr:hypothetical protein PybrP1_000215 [[Pythium] brassicae (nom. inval.)]